MMRDSTADYLRLALAEHNREAQELPPFSVVRAQIVQECNTLRDLLRANGQDTR